MFFISNNIQTTAIIELEFFLIAQVYSDLIVISIH